MLHSKYEKEQGPTPQYEVTNELSSLTLLFIISSIIYFLIGGSLAIIMRIIQSKVMLLTSQQTFGLFYAALTVHGQVMFFGFISMLTVGISYYLISKFAKKPLFSMRVAIWSFSLLNAGVILLIASGTMFFGAGWYNLLPLAFHPGNNGWSTFAATIFLVADAIIGIGLTLFCVNVIVTVLKGKIAVGMEKTEQADDNKHKYRSDDENDSGRVDLLPTENISSGAIRWISILGISSWFPKKYRSAVPTVSIVVVGVFINSLVQLIGNIGLFTQLSIGFMSLLSPNFEPNWLLAKDAWWFFGHPIVYFTLFSFLGAVYYYIPKYAKKTVPYDKWAYRSWPFYFIFTMMVFSHHVFMDTPNPVWLQMLSQAATFGVVFPSGLTIMTVMMYIFRSRIRWNITSLFMLAGIAGWAFGGFAGAQTGWWGTNVYLHNTLNIVGHIHLVILTGSVLFGLGLIYSIVPSITKKNLSNALGIIHLILTLIGGFGISLAFTYLGFAGFIRREADIPQQFAWAMPWLLFFAMIVGFGQIIFAYNLFHTLKRKKTDNDKLEIVEKAGITQEELDRQNEHIPTNERRDINQEAGQKLNNYGISSDRRSHMQRDNSGIIHYAGAAATALVGILHLTLVPFFVGFGSSTSVFFVATGIAQLFWVVPLLKQWGRLWYFIGIGGTVILILCWNIVNAPLSIRGLAAPYDIISIAVEVLQVVFIAIAAVILTLGGLFRRLRTADF
ncbi:MAG TPA: cbb3-type cytochrome c oxidase subunit I [Nitrososphaeraceae archaeon]|nr:cbb3-type cytochrome c oxidase subunit I [Nitrososphaeraceae archaeon]